MTITAYLSSTGSINSRETSLKGRIESVADDRATLGKRLEAIESRYRARFSAMDVLVGQLQNTGTYLEQQLKGLPGVVRKT